MKYITFALALFSALTTVLAQDGDPTIVVGGPNPYTCDTSACIPPKCFCASQNPPGGLSPSDTPQFVTVTFDDAVEPALVETAYEILDIVNPNGCKAKGSWYVSMDWTDFSLVQQWYALGHEVADHTFDHVPLPSAQEISSAKQMLNTYAGIPLGKIQGFRTPFLNYSAATLQEIAAQGFLYDTSSTAVVDDCYWPYTLDYGMANDCWTGICNPGTVKLPGVFEIPMYAVLDNNSVPQLMDVYLEGSVEDVANWSMTNFQRHYNGGRQPFGIYTHPTHLTNFSGLPDPTPQKEGMIAFLKEIAAMPDVWLVSNQQLLQWMQNPVPASELGNQTYMQCNAPDISTQICNGLETINSTGVGVEMVISSPLLNDCNFVNTTWNTCFNCPATAPTLTNPTPATAVQNSTAGFRYPLPDDCDTVWWDPVGNKCLCTTSSCAYKDTAVPVNSTTNSSSSSGSSSANASSASTITGAAMAMMAVVVSALSLAL